MTSMPFNGYCTQCLMNVDDGRNEEEHSKQDRCGLARIIRVDWRSVRNIATRVTRFWTYQKAYCFEGNR